MAEHRCAHGRADHRHNGAGRCNRPGCACLVGPGRLNKPVVAERTPAGGVLTVDGNGTVLDYQPAARHSESERTRLERMLWRRIEEAGLPLPVKQFYWARPERMFRSDFAYVAERILLEVQGGIWAANPGRHNRGSGYQADCERSNLAVILGWKLLAFTERMIKSGEAVQTIKLAIETRFQPQQIALGGRL